MTTVSRALRGSMRFRDSMQAAINDLETGRSRQVVLGILVLLITLGGLFVHGKHTFRGLRGPEAMENAQLARNLSRGQGFRTQCLRPADFWYARTQAAKTYSVHAHPDMRRPPGFPVLLAAVFSVTNPRFECVPNSGIFEPDWTAVAMSCIVLTALTAVLVFALAALLFDYRIGALAFALFVFTESVLDASLSGTGDALAMMLSVAGTILVILAARKLASADPGWTGWLYVIGAGFVVGWGILTDGFLLGFALGLPVVLVRAAQGVRRWMAPGLFVIVICATVGPWFIRNVQVSGDVVGPASLGAVEGTVLAADGSLQRSVEPAYNRLAVSRVVQRKLGRAIVDGYEADLPGLGSGLVAVFFLVSLFCPLLQPRVNDLRWGVLLGLVWMLAAGALGGPGGDRRCMALLPHVIIFGGVFFIAVTDRETLTATGMRSLLVVLFVVLTAWPGLSRSLRASRETYPPYYPPFIRYVCASLGRGEVLCTDIPWAAAWYGDCTSILLPSSLADFKVLHQQRGPFAALYLTQETRRRNDSEGLGRPGVSPWSAVLDGVIPDDFPLEHGVFLPPDTKDQLFLADRLRWPVHEPTGLAEDEVEIRYDETSP